MTRRRVGLVATAAIIGTLAVVGIVIQPQAVEIGVTIYEDAGGGGDHFFTSGIPPNYPKQPNLANITSGLNGGCNRGINQSSTWNDCVSSARVTSLPANTKIIFYQGANYSSTQTCRDTDGSVLYDLSSTGDTISSFRIVSGSC